MNPIYIVTNAKVKPIVGTNFAELVPGYIVPWGFSLNDYLYFFTREDGQIYVCNRLRFDTDNKTLIGATYWNETTLRERVSLIVQQSDFIENCNAYLQKLFVDIVNVKLVISLNENTLISQPYHIENRDQNV